MLPSPFSSFRRTHPTTRPPTTRPFPHRLDPQRSSRLATFGRNLSAQSRNLATNVVDGMPATIKELLARRCLGHGTAAFTNTILPRQLLPDSPIEEKKDVFNAEWANWVDYSGDTLVESNAPSDKVPFSLGKYHCTSPTFTPPSESFTGTTTRPERPSSPDQLAIASPFADNYAVDGESKAIWRNGPVFSAGPNVHAWGPNLTRRPASDTSQDGHLPSDTHPDHSSFLSDLDPDSSIYFAAPEDDIARETTDYTGLGVHPHDRPFDPTSIDDPFQDPISETLDGIYNNLNPFISPGAELESDLALGCHPSSTPGYPYPRDEGVNTDDPSGSRVRTLHTGDGGDEEGDVSFLWDEPSMTLPGSLRPDETPYSIPDFFAALR